MGFRDRLTALAETVADEARARTTDAVQDARGHATRGARWLADRDPSASARLKLMADENARLSVEAFLVLLLDTMNADDDDDTPTAKQVERAGRRRARRAGIVGIWGGPAGLCLASLYSEAMLVCDIVDRHDLDLTDEQIAAHLLVLWGLSPNLDSATAAIEGTGPSVAEQVLGDRVLDDKPITELRPKDAVMVLWRMRQLMDPDELPGTTKMRHFALPKRRVRRVTQDVEAQLGVSSTLSAEDEKEEPTPAVEAKSTATLDPASIGLDG
jgi:hypothetical protein